ncbi:hypothetical protein APSETT444_003036 [Aspergillus pseudonomiae]
METELFDESWIGKVISFTEPNARWRLTEKLRDKNDQFSAGEINDFPDAVSGAYGTFECENVDCHTELAIMRIAMQECVAKGFRLYGDVSSLFWDSSSDKMPVSFLCFIGYKTDNSSTIYNSMTAAPTEPSTEWSHVEWIAWGLAKASAGYRWWTEPKKDPDMRKWTL